MNGRWTIGPVGRTRKGSPWLVLRAGAIEAAQWNGPVLTLETRAVRHLGPDILADDDGSVDARPSSPQRLRGHGARRGAPGSTARGGNREHVDVGDPLGCRVSRPGCRSSLSATRISLPH